MYTAVKARDLITGTGRTARFDGDAYGSGVSFFLVDNDPGEGPDLHRHPYTETWVVRSGRALITADGEQIEVEPGDILVVGAGTHHKFENLGPGRLEIMCIHASPRIIQEDLDDVEDG